MNLSIFQTRIAVIALFFYAMAAGTAAADKTLVAWVQLTTLEQQGGSALALQDGDRFDAIVYGECLAHRWMAGSEYFHRTEKEQAGNSAENASPDTLVQIAVVYSGNSILIYRQGEMYASYATENMSLDLTDQSQVMFGLRHVNGSGDLFSGVIEDARIYRQALTAEQIRGLRPNTVSSIEPAAWWSFEEGALRDHTGTFPYVTLHGQPRVYDGQLVLDGSSYIVASKQRAAAPDRAATGGQAVSVQAVRTFRERLLDDPARPRYHFCLPDDMGIPGDVNGAFYADGRYHLMYLYDRQGSGFCWGHVSSADLLHWRHHPDAIAPGEGDEGAFSGGAFVDDDGTVYLSYWMLAGARGIGLVKNLDRTYERWEKFKSNPVIRSTEWGITEAVDSHGNKVVYGSADPSNIWKKDGKYYMALGNLLVLNKYGRKPDAPAAMRGDHLYLVESTDLNTWTYKGEFYERRDAWTDGSEDNMCPSFLPLPSGPDGGEASGKHLLLFISHNRGCQYLVGDYDQAGDRFLPQSHGRMTWVDNTFFAPEALVDGQGRQLMWAWLQDNPEGEKEKGWSGVYSLPRTLWVDQDNQLRMRPVKEVEQLRYGQRNWQDIRLKDGGIKRLDGIVGDSCELALTIRPGGRWQKAGIKVRVSPDGREETLLYVDAEKGQLVMDTTRSGVDGRRVVERAPFAYTASRPVELRVFVDKSVIEVFADDRQAICRRVYPGQKDSLGTVLFSEGGTATFSTVHAWEMMPTNPY